MLTHVLELVVCILRTPALIDALCFGLLESSDQFSDLGLHFSCNKETKD